MSNWDMLNKHRVIEGDFKSTPEDGCNGIFFFNLLGLKLRAIASDGGGWKHVSVSIVGSHSTLPWEMMCRVKDLFFEPEDCVVQYHPPKSNYVNNHPGVLHLWMLTDGKMPTPPKEFV